MKVKHKIGSVFIIVAVLISLVIRIRPILFPTYQEVLKKYWGIEIPKPVQIVEIKSQANEGIRSYKLEYENNKIDTFLKENKVLIKVSENSPYKVLKLIGKFEDNTEYYYIMKDANTYYSKIIIFQIKDNIIITIEDLG